MHQGCLISRGISEYASGFNGYRHYIARLHGIYFSFEAKGVGSDKLPTQVYVLLLRYYWFIYLLLDISAEGASEEIFAHGLDADFSIKHGPFSDYHMPEKMTIPPHFTGRNTSVLR